MPAAAVIPAPRVYIKAVAIKTLVVNVVVVCLCGDFASSSLKGAVWKTHKGHDRWFSLEIVLGWTIRKNWMEYFEQNRTIEVDSLV